jgi:transposase InsO family protein
MRYESNKSKEGAPEEIISDNGTEFTSAAVLSWCHERNQLKWSLLSRPKF